jgi:hypothetical protein
MVYNFEYSEWNWDRTPEWPSRQLPKGIDVRAPEKMLMVDTSPVAYGVRINPWVAPAESV